MQKSHVADHAPMPVPLPPEPSTGGLRLALHTRCTNQRVVRRFPLNAPCAILFSWARTVEPDCATGNFALVLLDGSRLLSTDVRLHHLTLEALRAQLANSLVRALPVDENGNVNLPL